MNPTQLPLYPEVSTPVDAAVRAAFDKVRSLSASTAKVTYCMVTVESRWCFMDDDFRCPSFDELFDVSVIETMVDTVSNEGIAVPTVFYLPLAEA